MNLNISSIMSKVLKIIFGIIVILRFISAFLLAYYFLLTKTLTFLNDQLFYTKMDEQIKNLHNIYTKLNNILVISVAFVCILIFNPFYSLSYNIDDRFKYVLYYYGVIVIYDRLFYYILVNHILVGFNSISNPLVKLH